MPRVYLIVASAILFIAAFWAYGEIGEVGFFLDDFSSIVNNPILKPPVDWPILIQTYNLRLVAYTSLAFQYALFGEEPSYYHYVGLLLHVTMSALISVFVYILFQQKKITNNAKVFSVLAGCLFFFHPQNSQAVIYIVQQTTVLVALFYILGLICFCKFLDSSSSTRTAVGTLAGAVLFGVLACLTKQNAFTYPLALFSIWSYRRGGLPYCVTALLVIVTGLILTALYLFWEQGLQFIDLMTRETNDVSRVTYLTSQVVIVKDYIFQFFWPYPLRMEYSAELYSMSQPEVWIAIGVHLSIFTIALLLRKKNPLFLLGVALYYIAHMVESGFIPIRDMAFEHRTYLPNVGLILVVISLLKSFMQPMSPYGKRSVWLVIFSVVMLYAYFDNQRVSQWSDKVSFYQHEIEFTKDRPRPFLGLAEAYIEVNKCGLAIGYFEHALNLYEINQRQDERPKLGLFLNYVKCLQTLGIKDRAFIYYEELLKAVAEPIARSQIFSQLGAYYFDLQDLKNAEHYLREAIKLNNKNYHAVINYAILQANSSDPLSSIPMLRYALKIKPNDPSALKILNDLNVDI